MNLDSIEVCDFVGVEDGAQVFGVGAEDVANVFGDEPRITMLVGERAHVVAVEFEWCNLIGVH